MTLQEQITHVVNMNADDEDAADLVLNDENFNDVFDEPDVSYLSKDEQILFYKNLCKLYVWSYL